MWRSWHRPEGAREWSAVISGDDETEVRIETHQRRLPGEVMFLPGDLDPNHPRDVEPEHGPHAIRQHMGRTEAMAVRRGREAWRLATGGH